MASKKIVSLIVAVIIILLLISGFLYFNNVPKKKVGSWNLAYYYEDKPRNYQVENELSSIITEILQEQNSLIKIDELFVIEGNDSFYGIVSFKCAGESEFVEEEKIISGIANKLFEKYPEKLGENSNWNSEVEILSCSLTGGSSDGINTSYHNTRWLISNGFYDFAV